MHEPQKPSCTFLEEVAHDLYDRYADNLSACRMLFPSRRARLFFVDALTRIVRKPLWQPRPTSVDELMEQISGLHAADKLRLVTELYRVYARHHAEPFDKFYFWGEMLLSDFDMIDKYRIDAAQLFRNIADLKELEADISYLTPRQMEIITKFWSTLGPEADLSKEKRRFLAIWNSLYAVYTEFRERLSKLGIAYGGMVQRAAADRLERDDFSFAEPMHFVVVGFNALSSCERVLFKYLQTHATTDFYWDCDRYYTRHTEQEAGMFIRRNLVDFPPAKDLMTNAIAAPASYHSVAAVSNAVQCKYAAEVLSAWAEKHPLDKETAVVLTDENLLLPLLYALPDSVGKVNVTMGYPLRQTLAYTFVERLVELQAHARSEAGGDSFYYVDVQGLLAHPYLSDCNRERVVAMQQEIVERRRIRIPAADLAFHPLLETLFRRTESWQAMSEWMVQMIQGVAREEYKGEDAARRTEFLAVVSEEIHKLANSLVHCEIDISTEVYTSLLRRHLQTVRIPFRGEPLEGIQVMGILETRALDFKRVVILSMTDDNFPGNHMAQASFIPYNLRSAFELPTPEHHEGVYAYYFYRLIQRAEEVTMLYCSHADEKSTGEPSRYIRQLAYESGHRPVEVEVGVDVNLMRAEAIEVDKDERVLASLERFVDPNSKATLSPTALFRYVACPLRFYFHSVARLKSDESVSEDIDAPMFGTILHAAVQELYGKVENELHPADTLQAMLKAGYVEKVVEQAIATHYLNRPEATKEEYPGNLLLVRDIVIRYVKHVVRYDMAHGDFTVLGRECPVDYRFPFEVEGRKHSLKLGGIVDRLDRLDSGMLRVVDYKTGAPHLEFKGVESLFNGEARDRQSNILQTLLYAMMLSHNHQTDASPTLYYVRNMHKEEYSPMLVDTAQGWQGAPYSYYAEPFEELLRETLTEMYDPKVPFRQCDDPKTCEYCDFKAICRR